MLRHSQTGSPNTFLPILDAHAAGWPRAKKLHRKNEACGSGLCRAFLRNRAIRVSLAGKPKRDRQLMKKTFLGLLLAAPLACLQAQAPVQGFNDIRFWAGSGTNQAALVLQWNDSGIPASLVWGYRWNGNATGLDMLRAVAGTTRIADLAGDPLGSDYGADARLALDLVQYSFGLSVVSLDYADAQGAQRTQSDWDSGYWEYFIRGGNFEYTNWGEAEPSLYAIPGSPDYAAGMWLSSPIGAGDRPLIDGAWDAYSFAAGFASQSVAQPVAVPIPLPVPYCTIVASKPHIAAKSEAGFNYRLYSASNLEGPWLPRGGGVPGDGQEIVFIDETPVQGLGAEARFYRIEVSQ
jgi:hypothetical protein